MAFSPPSLLDLPAELKSLILGKLDVKSLLNMSMTCKSINGLIHSTSEFALEIEVAKSELIPAAHIRSSAIARRRLLQEYRTSRLTLPIETRHCDSIVGLGATIVMQRLFRGLLACITDNSTLHVWNIRHHPDSSPPPKIFMISMSWAELIDVLIEPQYNLLILLCNHSGSNNTILKFMDLNSNGTKPHPLAPRHPLIVSEEQSDSVEGRQFLTLYGPLLSLVYCHRNDEGFRRGIILDWRTGNILHDSMNFDSTSDFHDLLLLTSWSFLVAASTPFDGPPTALGAWIELWVCGSPASRLVAKFHLPDFDETTKYDLEDLLFFASEPPSHTICSYGDNEIFPFVSEPSATVHVLHIWYTSRPEIPHTYDPQVYLVISNRVFLDVLKKLATQVVTDDTLPLCIEWDVWGPPWTSVWETEELESFSDCSISSVCGSRICSLSHLADGCIGLLVVDFNMNFPCTERDCADPLVHLSPKSFRSGLAPLWAHVVHTWLPFHTQRKWIKIPDTNGELMMCFMVIMDEERIVIPTAPYETPTFNPTCWKIIHMLRDKQNPSIGDDHVLPWGEDVDHRLLNQVMHHDRICRLCKEKPHTDPHILLECTTHAEVVQLRQSLIEHITHRHPALYSTWSKHSFDKLLDEIKVLRGAQIRILISSLVSGINKIYWQLDPCSELVSVDHDNSASLYFITMPSPMLYD